MLVNISNTIGQTSAIEANGGPVFAIKVTQAAWFTPTGQEVPGFGRVISEGPVNGFEILYKPSSVV